MSKIYRIVKRAKMALFSKINLQQNSYWRKEALWIEAYVFRREGFV